MSELRHKREENSAKVERDGYKCPRTDSGFESATKSVCRASLSSGSKGLPIGTWSFAGARNCLHGNSEGTKLVGRRRDSRRSGGLPF